MSISTVAVLGNNILGPAVGTERWINGYDLCKPCLSMVCLKYQSNCFLFSPHVVSTFNLVQGLFPLNWS